MCLAVASASPGICSRCCAASCSPQMDALHAPVRSQDEALIVSEKLTGSSAVTRPAFAAACNPCVSSRATT